MNRNTCRISFTEAIPADDSTYHIKLDSFITSTRLHKNTYITYEKSEVIDFLYHIMEKYDMLDEYLIFCDNWKQVLDFLIFLRNENPKKIISLYCLDESKNGCYYEPQSMDEHDVFTVINSIAYINSK